MNPLYEAVDRMPFVGKCLIKPTIEEYVRSTPEEGERFKHTVAVLGAFALLHTCQAYMGQESFFIHMNHLRTTGNASNAIMAGLDLLYTTANAAVTMRQASLLNRVCGIQSRRKRKNQDTKTTTTNTSERIAKNTIETAKPQSLEHKKAETRAAITATAFTLIAQALFISSYVEGYITESHIKCRQQAAQNVQDYKEIHGDVLMQQDEEEYISRVC